MSTAPEQGTMLAAALDLAARGFRVFALDGKKPARKGWQKRATKDPTKVCALWEGHPAANVGIATGAGIYVLDADGPDGLAAFAALALPATLTARSGRKDGGMHAFYRLPGGVELANASGATIARGVDGRGEGGFVVGAGSLHASGARYAWSADVAMAELPAWLIEKLASRAARGTVSIPSDDELAAAQERFAGLPAGDRGELEKETRERVTRAATGLAALPAGEGNGRGDKVHGYAISLGECVGAGALDLEAARAVIAGALDAGTAALHERSSARGLAMGIAKPLAVEPACLGVFACGGISSSNIRSYSGVPGPEIPSSSPKDRGATTTPVEGNVVASSGVGERRSDQTGRTGVRSRYDGRLIDIRAELAKPPEPIPYRCGTLTADGMHVVISGRAGLGKSWLLLALAHGVSTGTTVAGIDCAHGPALLIDGEMGRAQLIDRIRGADIGAACYAYNADGLDLTLPDDLAWLEAVIREHVPAGGFVGIDSLRKLMGRASENDSDSMARAVASLTTLARDTGASITTLHHEGWEAGRSRGSTAIVDQVDAAFSLQRLPDELEDSGVRRLTCNGPGGKMRFGRSPADLYVRLSDTGLIVAGERPEPKAVQYRQAILDVLPKGKTAAATACATTHSNRTWAAAWDALEADGAIVKTKTGQWTTAAEDRVLRSTEEPAI